MSCRRCKESTCPGCLPEVACTACEQPVSIDHTDARGRCPGCADGPSTLLIVAEEVDDLPCPRCGYKRGHARAEFERSDREHPQFELLTDTLELAVPLEIANLQRLPWEVVKRIAQESANLVAARADVMMFKGGERGAAGRAFAALTRGLAACSFSVLGVSFRGFHWCAKHPDSPATEGQYEVGRDCADAPDSPEDCPACPPGDVCDAHFVGGAL